MIAIIQVHHHDPVETMVLLLVTMITTSIVPLPLLPLLCLL